MALKGREDFDLNDPIVPPASEDVIPSSFAPRGSFPSVIQYLGDTFRAGPFLERGESSRQPADNKGDKPRPKRLRLLGACDRLSEFLSCYNGTKSAILPLRSHLTLVGRNTSFRGIVIPLEVFHLSSMLLLSTATSWHVVMLLIC